MLFASVWPTTMPLLRSTLTEVNIHPSAQPSEMGWSSKPDIVGLTVKFGPVAVPAGEVTLTGPSTTLAGTVTVRS